MFSSRKPNVPTRPIRWEDDISINALNDAPFENRVPLSSWAKEDLKIVNNGRAPVEIVHLDLHAAIDRDTMPIPSNLDRENYSPDFDEYYWLSGYRDFVVAMGGLEKFGVKPERIMEMGCASGRVLRHFALQSDIPEIWGTDINQRHIRWLLEYMPAHVAALSLPSLPSFPIEDAYFDAVMAFSVFTHIDTFELSYLAEIRRILRPGGIAYLTVHTEETWEAASQDFPQAESMRNRMSNVVPDLEAKLGEPLPEGRTQYRHSDIGPYRGMVFHSKSYIQNAWGRFFEICEIVPMGHALQTVVVLRKPTR